MRWNSFCIKTPYSILFISRCFSVIATSNKSRDNHHNTYSYRVDKEMENSLFSSTYISISTDFLTNPTQTEIKKILIQLVFSISMKWNLWWNNESIFLILFSFLVLFYSHLPHHGHIDIRINLLFLSQNERDLYL